MTGLPEELRNASGEGEVQAEDPHESSAPESATAAHEQTEKAAPDSEPTAAPEAASEAAQPDPAPAEAQDESDAAPPQQEAHTATAAAPPPPVGQAPPAGPPPPLPMSAPKPVEPPLRAPQPPPELATQAADVEQIEAAPPAQTEPPEALVPAPAAEEDHPAPAMPLPPSSDEAGEGEGEEFLDPAEAEAYAAFVGAGDISVVRLQPGDRRTGRVISSGDDGVVVDLGGKTDGLLSSRTQDAAALTALEIGAEVDVVVVAAGEPGEYAELALAREENVEAWNTLEEAFQQQRPVQGKITERVKGGLTVDVGVPAFLPGSQVDLHVVHDLDAMIGQQIEVAVVKLSRRRGNAVVSRRALLEAEARRLKEETLSGIEVGAEVTGTVKNVTSYGAFVDLGGVDGLIHVTDISYGRVKDPSDALTPGQEVAAKVVRFDREKERVSLSLKDMQPDPWKSAAERIREGDRVSGTVASITDYGAFVEIEPGVEGLVHITELTWSKRLKHPSKILKEGQPVEAVVLKLQPGQRRISLSLRMTEPDPWTDAESRFPMGTIVEGRVRNVTTYGAFVEIEEGVDGLVHVSDLSWDSRVRNPKDVVKKGQQVKAVVLSLDEANRRMSLGIKQLEADIWETFFSTHMVGDAVVGRVTRQAKFGAFVELSPGIEGLCHNSEMPRREAGRKGGLQTGKSYRFEIIKLDEFEKRIGLRCEEATPVEPQPSAEEAASS